MFSRLATISAAEEKPEIYSLLMVGLALMAHIMFLFGLVMGSMVVVDLPYFRGATPLTLIVVLALVADLFRFPVIAARSQARRAFGLDTRSFWRRFRYLAVREFIGLLVVIALTYGLLSLLGEVSLAIWSLTLFLVAQSLVWLPCLWERAEPRLFPKRFRALRTGELPESLPKVVKSLPLPKDWNLKQPLVYLNPTFGLPWPKINGQRLIIPQIALEMPKGALKHRLITAILGRIVKAEGLIIILRALTMSLAVPLTLFFLGGLGFLWRFPQEFSPVLVPCLWLAVGISHFISRAMVRFVRRLLERKLSAAAVLATWDVPAFQASLEVASRLDLEPDGNPWWFWFSRSRPGTIEQIEQIKEQIQIIAKLQPSNPAQAAKKPKNFETSDQEGANA
ncbi:MAG: hypothetical protein LBI10_01735 [Deltaproteobacteria bacterium]|jgi:hypothetical protein|nr:hypothetical protein [Deltaproteobacteria bacterium]